MWSRSAIVRASRSIALPSALLARSRNAPTVLAGCGLPAHLPGASSSATRPSGRAAALERRALSSGAEAASLAKLTAELRTLAQQGEVTAEDAQPLVEQALALSWAASLEDVASLAEALCDARLRVPLRDLLPAVIQKVTGADGVVRPGPEALNSVIRLASATGRANLFLNELFEFCSGHVNSMQASDMALFMFEAGRHGLRCRHFTDTAVGRAVELLPSMNLQEVMWTWQGLVRQSKDKRQFYMAALPRVRQEVAALQVPQLLLALRAARDLKHVDGFVDLHASCCTQLMLHIQTMSLNEAAQCLQLTAFFPKYRAQAQALVRSVEQKLSKAEDLKELRVSEVVDALETFASWGMKPLPLLERLDKLLVDNQAELKYAGNVSLWINAVQAFAKMEHFDARWPEVALDMARDKPFVERTNFFLQCSLVVALSKLRLFDETVYRNVAELLVSDVRLFKEVQDISPVLSAYAWAGYFHPELFGATYDLIIEFMEVESLDLSKNTHQGGLIQAAWAFALAGFHRRYESFAAYLDYALFKDLAEHKPPVLRRLAHVADAALQEAPTMAANCQYPDKLAEARTNQRARSIIASEPITEPKLLTEIRTTLQAMQWPFEVFHVPDNTSAFYVDVSLKQKFGEPVGLLLGGRHQFFKVGLEHEAQAPRPSGQLVLAQRLLATRGWKLAVVGKHQWAALKDDAERRQFLEAAVQRARQEASSSA